QIARLGSGAARTAVVLVPNRALGEELAAALRDEGVERVLLLERAGRGVDRDARVVIADAGGFHDPLLVQHEHWHHIWRNVSLVAVAHAEEFTGVLGSHAAWFMRRAARVVHLAKSAGAALGVGSGPGAGAEVAGPVRIVVGFGLANARDHAESLLGSAVDIVGGQDYVALPRVLVDAAAAEGACRDTIRGALVEEERWRGVRVHSLGRELSPRSPGIWLVERPGPIEWFRSTRGKVARRHAAHDHEADTVRIDQLLAASAEAPLAPGDDRWFGAGAWSLLEALDQRLVLGEEAEDGSVESAWRYRGWEPPGALVQPEALERAPFRVVTSGRVYEVVGALCHGEVAFAAHPGAILEVGGEHFRVRDVDLDEREIWVSRQKKAAIESGRGTVPRHRRHHEITEVMRTRAPLGDGSLPVLGRVEVIDTVTGYSLSRTAGRKAEACGLDPPFVTTYLTTCAWIDLVPARSTEIEAAGGDRTEVLNFVADLLGRFLILRIGTEHFGEVVVAAYRSHAALDGGGIFVHEAMPCGAGAAGAFLDLLPELLESAARTLRSGTALPPRVLGRLSGGDERGDSAIARSSLALLERLLARSR
ncbi:MAG: hypothetical protein CME06_07145, partial [Gemmatimonadetes bacterium]|nr:hypothetical protein [Gemmatimonadota bacterium]